LPIGKITPVCPLPGTAAERDDPMKSKDLKSLGVFSTEATKLAFETILLGRKQGLSLDALREKIRQAAESPSAWLQDPLCGSLAAELLKQEEGPEPFTPRSEPAPFKQWGDDLDPSSVQQLRNACQLPVAVRGALMPDAHRGYGLPIGGVLATRNAVIPYAVGVDIACRVKMTVLDMPPSTLRQRREIFEQAIQSETRFGIGANFKQKRRHQVLDEDWGITRMIGGLKDKAWAQLGSSGSGNHFVEFGLFRTDQPGLGLQPGTYLALLSHSGSRGAGARIANHYSKLAMQQHPDLPSQLKHLAWLDLSSAEGEEYWRAMQLMGRYAAANHSCIHRHIAQHLGAKVLLDLENHHNFAWKETHDGEEVIVHRKGATPAGKGVLGIIPGSMATATYVVRGRGNRDSLESAAHGAGRVMSRTKAKKTLSWKEAKVMLDQKGITLMSAGLDEVPMVYKDIHSVLAAQSDLVEPLATFQPRLVKMAPSGERPED
jgi:tRNA-splicing ligase RtcB